MLGSVGRAISRLSTSGWPVMFFSPGIGFMIRSFRHRTPLCRQCTRTAEIFHINKFRVEYKRCHLTIPTSTITLFNTVCSNSILSYDSFTCRAWTTVTDGQSFPKWRTDFIFSFEYFFFILSLNLVQAVHGHSAPLCGGQY